MQMKAVFYGHKDKNEKELDMRKNRKNNSHTYRKRICIMAVLLAGSLMLGGVQERKRKRQTTNCRRLSLEWIILNLAVIR